MRHLRPSVVWSTTGCRAPTPDLPALATERGGSTLCGHSHRSDAPANPFLEHEAGDFNNAMNARSGGARSPDRARAHRRAVPPGRLLLGSDLNAAGEATARISGIVMLCLAAGCWPRASESGRLQSLVPLVALSWLAAAFLVITGLTGATVGLLLWPAAALHVILAVLLTWTRASAPAA